MLCFEKIIIIASYTFLFVLITSFEKYINVCIWVVLKFFLAILKWVFNKQFLFECVVYSFNKPSNHELGVRTGSNVEILGLGAPFRYRNM